MVKKYKWIKIVDIRESGYEYENCMMKKGLFGITIKLPSEKAQEVSVFFPYSNIISVRTVRDV